MDFPIDPATKQRTERDWLRNRDAIDERLAESMAEVEQGKVFSPVEVRSLLESDRKMRAACSR